MLGYLRLEIRRTFRDRRYIIMSVGFPVILYLLMANIYGSGDTDSVTGLTAAAYMLVGFGVYGAIGATMSATGPRLAMELQTGWLRQLAVTPLRSWQVITAKALAAMILALPALVTVGAAAALTQDVSLSPGKWLLLLVIGWLGTLPFAALGTLIGSLFEGDSAQPAMLLCYLVLSVAGGLWIPMGELPHALRDIAKWTPTNRLAELGWDVVGGHALPAAAILVLVAWALALGTLAAAAYRRAAART